MKEQSREESSLDGKCGEKHRALKRCDRVVARIAVEILDLETLETQNNDQLDYFVNDEVSFSIDDLKKGVSKCLYSWKRERSKRYNVGQRTNRLSKMILQKQKKKR